jgi:hypothetical protein
MRGRAASDPSGSRLPAVPTHRVKRVFRSSWISRQWFTCDGKQGNQKEGRVTYGAMPPPVMTSRFADLLQAQGSNPHAMGSSPKTWYRPQSLLQIPEVVPPPGLEPGQAV